MPSPPKSPPIGIRYISDAVKSDHRRLEKLHASLLATPATSSPESQRRALQSRLSWELARYLVAMDLFIFPGTNLRAKQGNQAARDRQRDMERLRAALRDFSKAAKDDTDDGKAVAEALEQLGEHLRRHIRSVERVDLVNIEKVLSGRQSEMLARDFERTSYFLPEGIRDDGEDDGVVAPYGSVEEFLGASFEELGAAMERFPRD